MIPIKLTIEGLYSYQSKQTIDFTRLTSAGLFGIFGPVGSGKSAILEAITFALYGRTDRLNLSGDNRNYNMMNLKSSELLIDFIFEAGGDQNLFRSIVKGRRNSKQFEEVRALERTFYMKRAGEWEPVEERVLEEAIGLSYDNFKRTIIIPQGQFQEFLQLGNRDRTRMLKELFNLEKYEFYYQAVALESENTAQLKMLEGRLQQLDEADEEKVKVYEQQLKELAGRIAEKRALLNKRLQREAELKKLSELVQKLQAAEETLSRLKKEEPEYAALEQSIARYEACRFGFMHLFDSLNELEKSKKSRLEDIAEDREILQEQNQEIRRIGLTIKELKPDYEQRETLQKRAADLAILLQMHQSELAVRHKKKRLELGRSYIDGCVQQIDKLNGEIEETGLSIKKIRNERLDPAQLHAIKSWYRKRNDLEQQLAELEKWMDEIKEKGKEGERALAALLQKPLLRGLPRGADYAERKGWLADEQKRLKQLAEKEAEKEHQMLVKRELKKYASELHPGTPCPLCGSLEHPNPQTHEADSSAWEQGSKLKKEYEQQIEKLKQYDVQMDLLHNDAVHAAERINKLLEKRRITRHSMNVHQTQAIQSRFKNETELDRAIEETEKRQKEEERLEALLEALNGKLKEEEKKRETYRAGADKIRNELTGEETRLATLRQQLQTVDPETYRESDAQDIEEERKQLLATYEQVVKQYEENNELLQGLMRNNQSLQAALQIKSKELEQNLDSMHKIVAKMEEEVSKSDLFMNLGEVKEILASKRDVASEKKRVAAFKEQMQVQNTLREDLRKEMGDQTYDRDAHEELIQEIATLKDEEGKATQMQVEVNLLLKQLKSDLEEKKKLLNEQKQLDVRAENIRTMKSLFKASGFVNWVSTVYLQNLCVAANDRFFKLTRQKLSLELTPDNNFRVRDFMNEGKVRSVKTLSGGQTFQASLSLALALADNIQRVTQSSRNFFFLDEGFGTLDRASLDIVFDTLKSLQKEHRIVGIISHVEEMQQEVGTHLRIVNDPDKGSLIFRGGEL